MQGLSTGTVLQTLYHRGRQMNCRRFGSLLPMIRHRRRALSSPPHSSSSATGQRVCNASSTARTSADTGFISWYTRQLDERPISTKIITSGLIAASGDVICQLLENNFAVENRNQNDADSDALGEVTKDCQINNSTTATKPTEHPLDTHIDWYRTARFWLIGSFWVAPATHSWYGFLSTRLIPGSATPKRVVQRLLLDQFGAAPVFAPVFMGLLWLLEGKPSSEVKSDLVEAAPTIVTNNWKLWFPAMGFMFSVVPLKFQVVYSNFVGLVWTVYLSYASTRLSSQPLDQQ